MGNSASSWLIIVLAVLAANLPFLNERCFGIIPLQRFAFLKSIFFRTPELASGVYLAVIDPHADGEIMSSSDRPTLKNEVLTDVPALVVKSLWLRLLELIILYFIVGAIAFVLESAAGNRFPQGWEFYAINACLFLVLAFPGFVYRYLKRDHG